MGPVPWCPEASLSITGQKFVEFLAATGPVPVALARGRGAQCPELPACHICLLLLGAPHGAQIASD